MEGPSLYLPVGPGGMPPPEATPLREEAPLQMGSPKGLSRHGRLHAQRYCTDLPCALAFVSFLMGLGYIYSFARAEGNLAKLTHGFDWKGDICGVDEAVRHLPLLFWCAPSVGEDISLLDGVCVSECPSGANTRTWCPGRALHFEHAELGLAGTQEVVVGTVRNLTEMPDYPSMEAFGYCFPKQNMVLLNRIVDQTHLSTFTKQLVLAGHGAIESWRFLVAVACSCIIIGYGFLFILWACFDKLIYGLLIAAHLLLLFVSSACIYVGFHEEQNFFTNYLGGQAASLCALVCGVMGFSIWVLYTVLCCYSKNAITVTIDSVKATCEVIGNLPSILLQPLLHSVVVLGAMLCLVYGFGWLLSTGKVVPQDEPLREGGVEVAGVHRIMEYTGQQRAFIVYWLFGFVWIVETVNALGQFAISHAVVLLACFDCQECFPMTHGYTVGLCFHLGTLAFGGFVIGCLKVLAAVLAIVSRQTRAEDGLQPAAGRAICCCCTYCVLCVEQLLTMVNDLVYTDVAIQGTGYVQAAENVVQVGASNPVTYASIKGSATAVRVLGVTVIGGTGTFLSYQVLASTALHQELDSVFTGASTSLATSSILGTTVAAGFICFYVAIAFMMVFYQTTYTLMYCMLLGGLQTSPGSPGTALAGDSSPRRVMLSTDKV